MTEKENTKKYDDLTSGFYGHVNQTIKTTTGATLIELHLAEWGEEAPWECADWYFDDGTDEPVHVANCNGHEGVGWQDAYHDLPEGTREELNELVSPYELTGLYLEARIAGLEEADPGNPGGGEFVIIETANYFNSDVNAAWNNRPKVLTEDEPGGNELVFDTYQKAKDYLDNHESGTYYLSHGEAGRPDYKIMKL